MAEDKLSGLKMPDVIENCWRCDHESLALTVKTVASPMRLEPGGRTLHSRMCSHCGYVVPVQGGFDSPELAALRWNGEQITQKKREAREAAAALSLSYKDLKD